MSFETYLTNTNWAGNFSIDSGCLKFTNSNGKAFLISIKDLKRSLRAIYIHSKKIAASLSDDWTYNEDRFRPAFSPSLSSIKDNTVATNLGSQTPNTINALALYAGYMLGRPIETQQVASRMLQKENLESLFSNKEKFRVWLGRKNLAPKSIDSYIGGIDGLLSNACGRLIFGIDDLETFEYTKREIEANADYVSTDQKGNGMYSAALNNYKQFLKDRIPSSGLIRLEPNFSSESAPIAQSLLTKPFTILTGASGTGKTRLAESLAKSYACGDESRYAVVAVGADWTDNRHVLGFVNHLRELPLYQSTPVLDLLLHADAHTDVPHFLVLDEMNLSHVERYFADFLSAMERPDGALDLHGAGAGDDTRLPRFDGDPVGVPRRLAFPKNLFVIGTVNVDETTYMFSPKVLDRANVIEFRMTDSDLGNFLTGDGSYPETEPATEEQAKSFLAAAQNRELEALPMMEEISGLLKEVFALMAKARFEFGYRATGEVIRYLKICRTLATDKTAWDDGGWKQDFDHQILQKLLPRLHGGMGRMGPLLTGLGHFCHGSALPAQARIDSLASLDKNTARFPKSFAKISVMAEVLREEQFVSFIC